MGQRRMHFIVLMTSRAALGPLLYFYDEPTDCMQATWKWLSNVKHGIPKKQKLKDASCAVQSSPVKSLKSRLDVPSIMNADATESADPPLPMLQLDEF